MPAPDLAPTGAVTHQRPFVVAVAADGEHRFSKPTRPVIRLLEGRGVEGDAHLGDRVQHRSRLRRAASAPNLRQVHLLHAELFDELLATGHRVEAGALGENITTSGVDLLSLPEGTALLLGDTAQVEVTGLRNPCRQIEDFQPGLLRQVIGRDADGSLVRRVGVMGVVRRGGEVRPGDRITVVLPEAPHRPLPVV
ncbi:MAG TPA: MOSC domain-containing protein [Nocardioidaceae bacterium]|nr:MOSC domain-containing protein [Nocardioidaceae bacterium]